MKKSALIIISVLLFILFIGMSELYVNNKVKPWPTKIDETKNKPIGTVLKDFYKAATRDYGPPEDGLKRVGSAFPDADRSQCKGVTKSPDDIMTVNFAGYVFEIPCTVKLKGKYLVVYNPDNSINNQNYSLFVSTSLGQDDRSIWSKGKHVENTQNFYIHLTSDGNKVDFSYAKKRIESMEEIGQVGTKNIMLFANKNFITAVGKDKSFDEGNALHLNCDRYGDVDPLELFTPFNNIGNKSQCSMIWRLTDDIKVIVIRMKSKFAYNYQEIHEILNQGLKDMIVKSPN